MLNYLFLLLKKHISSILLIGGTMKKRLISGILLALIFIGFYFLDSKYFIILTTLLSVLMYKEIISLKKYQLTVIILGLISIV